MPARYDCAGDPKGRTWSTSSRCPCGASSSGASSPSRILVVLHEGGHFLAARAVRREGARVHARPARSGAALPHEERHRVRGHRDPARRLRAHRGHGARRRGRAARPARSRRRRRRAGSTRADARRRSASRRTRAVAPGHARGLRGASSPHRTTRSATLRSGGRARRARPTTRCSTRVRSDLPRAGRPGSASPCSSGGRGREPRRRDPRLHGRAVASWGYSRRRRSRIDEVADRAARPHARACGRATASSRSTATTVEDWADAASRQLATTQARADRCDRSTYATGRRAATAHAVLGEDRTARAFLGVGPSSVRRAMPSVLAALAREPRAGPAWCSSRSRDFFDRAPARRSRRRSKDARSVVGISRRWSRAGGRGRPARLRVARRAPVAVARRR